MKKENNPSTSVYICCLPFALYSWIYHSSNQRKKKQPKVVVVFFLLLDHILIIDGFNQSSCPISGIICHCKLLFYFSNNDLVFFFSSSALSDRKSISLIDHTIRYANDGLWFYI